MSLWCNMYHAHNYNEAGLGFSRRRPAVHGVSCFLTSLYISRQFTWLVAVNCSVIVALWIFGPYEYMNMVLLTLIWSVFSIWCTFGSHTWRSEYILRNTTAWVPYFITLQSNLQVVFVFIVYTAQWCQTIHIFVYCRLKYAFQHISRYSLRFLCLWWGMSVCSESVSERSTLMFSGVHAGYI